MSRSDRFYAAIIPARAGSRGLPGKNWLTLEGISLVERAAASALESAHIDAVAISSDDSRAAPLAESLGITYIERSAHAASDSATAADVVAEALAKWPLLARDPKTTYVVYLQPTSPLRTSRHVSEAIKAMELAGAHASVALRKSPISAYKLTTLDESGRVRPIFDDRQATANRQSLPTTYLPNGALYVFRVSDFQSLGGIPVNGAVPYLMNPSESIDIDTRADWEWLVTRGTSTQ